MTTPVAGPVRPPQPPAPAPAPAPVSGRAAYTSVAVAGLLLMAAVPAFMLILGTLGGMTLTGEDLVFFGLHIVLLAAAAGLVWRFGLWAKIVGIVVALAGAAMLFWTVFGLAHPGSPGDFVSGVAYPLGFALAVGGGIAAIVAGRRGRQATSLIAAEKRILAVAGALVVLAVVVSVVTGFVQRDSAAADADAEITATLADFEFVEDGYEAAPGDTIQVHNADPFTHTFTVPDLGVDVVVLPGAYALVQLPDDAAAGTYTVYCEPHSDMSEPDHHEAGMASTLTIR